MGITRIHSFMIRSGEGKRHTPFAMSFAIVRRSLFIDHHLLLLSAAFLIISREAGRKPFP